MLRKIIFVIFAFVSFGFVVPVTAVCQSDKAKQIDEFVNHFVKAGQFGGVVLASENGKVIYEK